MTAWTSQDIALEMRDAIASIADSRIDLQRPASSYAEVVSINREARKAEVRMVGEDDPVVVAMGSIQPETTGQTVRIGGPMGARYIEDVLGNAIMSGADDRYAPAGSAGSGLACDPAGRRSIRRGDHRAGDWSWSTTAERQWVANINSAATARRWSHHRTCRFGTTPAHPGSGVRSRH